MKTPHTPRGGRMIIGLLACLCSSSSAFASDIPTGTLDVDRSLVLVGTRSALDWKINYPSGVSEIIEIPKISPKTSLTMRVRVLGSSFQENRTNAGGGNNYDDVDSSSPKTIKDGTYDPSGTYDDERKLGKAVLLPVEVMWSLNNATFTRLFYGTQSNVNPSSVVLNTTVQPGDTINFGGRGYRDKAWLPFYSTGTNSPNVLVLQNGDTVPSTIQQSFIEGILRPYLLSNNTVKIGTRDLIILMELGQANPIYADFNLQDLILLVTFE